MALQDIIVLLWLCRTEGDLSKSLVLIAVRTSTHIRETWKQQSEEKIEDDEIPHQDGGHEVGDAGLAADEDAVPHGFYPLPAQHSEHDHEAVHEVREVPPRHGAAVPAADIALVVLPEQLHPHHGEDEDDDAQHKGEVGESADGVHHDGEDVVERLPGLGELENSQQTERSEHW